MRRRVVLIVHIKHKVKKGQEEIIFFGLFTHTIDEIVCLQYFDAS